MTKQAIWLAIWRFTRVSVALLVSYWFTQITNDPKFLALAPVLVALSKWLREQYKVDLKVI